MFIAIACLLPIFVYPVTAVLANPFVVWTNGDSGNFTLELVLRLPTQTVIYPFVVSYHLALLSVRLNRYSVCVWYGFSLHCM